MTDTTYESYRNLLFPIAYNMLGSQADAEDLVQETLMKWWAMDHAAITNEKAYLTRALINKCLNFLRDHKKEVVRAATESEAPRETIPFRIEHGFSLSVGVQVLLAKLSPMERAVFLLKDVFGYSHKEIAEMLGISEANCRQILVRARRHMRGEQTRYDVHPDQHEQLYQTFVEVCQGEDLGQLLELLKEDIEIEIMRPAAVYRQNGRLPVAEYLLAEHRRGFDYAWLWLKDLPVLVAYLYGLPVKWIKLEGSPTEIERIEVYEWEMAPKKATLLIQD